MINKYLNKEEIENLYNERLKVCTTRRDGEPCECYTTDKEGCAFPLMQPTPCCDKREDGCGCSLPLLLRVPGSKCQKGYWDAVLTEEEQKELEQINYQKQFKKDTQ